jgi:hypothetical protein
MIVNYV